MRLPASYLFSITTSAILICVAIIMANNAKEVEAVTIAPIPFAGQIATVNLCCNGIVFVTTGQYKSVAYGSFIMEWSKMIPNPLLGLGLYSWWSILPTEKVLGSAIPGGVCLTIASECKTAIPVAWSVNQMGTTLTAI